MGKTNIGWAEMTWNPVTGCSKVSPGCAHCYAEALSLRFGTSKKPWTPEHAAENVVLHPERLDLPLHWRKPRMVFVNSMSDLFHELVPDEFILNVWLIMAMAKEHTFQVLTKRPDRMRDLLMRQWMPEKLRDIHRLFADDFWPLPNVWLGVSVENQHWADERIPLLLETPAAVRFISAEPLLGPIDLTPFLGWDACQAGEVCAQHTRLDWCIVGGESGRGFRPMDLAWAHSLRDQCAAAGVPYFFKQSSALRPGQPCGDAALDAAKEMPG